MAVAYFAMKLMKRNRYNRKKHTPEDYIEKKQEKDANFTYGIAYDSLCRICLKSGSIPIYDNNSDSTIVKSVQIFGDIQVDSVDAFPKHICEDCFSLLKSAIRFRQSAKKSDQLLHQKLSQKHYQISINNYSHTNEIQHSDDGLTEDNCTSLVKTSKSYYCKLCKLNFETNEEYTMHQNSKLHKKIRIQCKICRRLLTANLYKRHLARHDSASHLICEVCGKLFRKDNLIRHLQLHSFELPYQCQTCPYRGRYMESLKIHMRTHTGDKPFTCDKCELRFLTRSNLNRHLLTHKKERPFKCHECNKGFYTKRDMEVHFKSDHAGFKEFGCPMCGNKYGTKKALMRHELRVHKRDKMGRGRVPLYLQAEYQNYPESHSQSVSLLL